MQVASTSVVGFGFGSGEAQHGQMFSDLPQKRTYHPILEPLPRQLFANAAIAASRVAS
jgi:hypothetical protein